MKPMDVYNKRHILDLRTDELYMKPIHFRPAQFRQANNVYEIPNYNIIIYSNFFFIRFYNGIRYTCLHLIYR